MSEHVERAAALAERLRELHLPDAIGWWPPAPGWWVLGAALLAAGAWPLGRAWRERHARRHRRRTTAELQACHTEWHQTRETARYYASSARVLRRAAIAAGGRERVARLCGERWVDWLDANARVPFSSEVREVLADALYRRAPPERVARVHDELLRWAAERPLGHGRRTRA